MTAIIYEIFPVTCFEGKAFSIQNGTRYKSPVWHILHVAHLHPSAHVVQQLMHHFGQNIDARTLIVHSTSWRYESAADQLILTYIAVLPQGSWLKQWQEERRITLKPIHDLGKVYGDHISPPPHILPDHVLAHALDHLATLCQSDPEIQTVLDPAWQEILHLRIPRPAGYLPRYH